MTIQDFEYAMGFKVFLQGEKESFSAAVVSIQSAIPYALRRLVNRHWNIEKRAESYLRQWSEEMKQQGASRRAQI